MLSFICKMWDKILILLKKIYSKTTTFVECHNKVVFIVVMGIIGVCMFLLNYNTPLVADDFSYSFIYNTSEPVENVKDIVKSQYIHYMNWGGRTVNHSIAQLLLLFDKSVINILNTLVYVLMTYLIYLNCNYGKKTNVLLYMGINILLWLFQPVFGQSFLWVTGCANYMYGITIVLAFLLLYKIRFVKKDKYKHEGLLVPLIFIFGIVAGWTNENVAAAAVCIVLMYLVYYKLNNIKIVKTDVVGIIGLIIGFCILILAPGNYIRNEEFPQTNSFIVTIIKRILECSESLVQMVTPLIAIYVLVFIILKNINKESKNSIHAIFFIGMLISVYSMVLSPYFPYRAWTGVIIYIIMAIGNLCSELDYNNKLIKDLSYSLVLTASILVFVGYVNAYEESVKINNAWEQRIELIESQKESGNKNIEVDPIYTGNKYCASNGLADITTNPNYWTNSVISQYYELDSIKLKSN